MINQIQLIRNIGRFDSMTTVSNVELGRLTLLYAENGRGKTTLAAILRSLATGDRIPIVERRRLAAQHPPHVIIRCAGGPPAAIFQNGGWNRTLENMVVFDDSFIDQNVYSGLVLGGEHRQNLHELIIGSQGIVLNQKLQKLVTQIEVHNRNLRQRESSIPIAEHGGLTVEQFCALQANPNVAAEIDETERNLTAAREQETVKNTLAFELLSFPAFDLQKIEEVLQAGLQVMDAAAASQVQEHFATSGRNAEEWIGEGMIRQAERPLKVADECVFCAQSLDGSPVFRHYRVFFSDAYLRLKSTITDISAGLSEAHKDSVATSLERSVRILNERRQFWGRFVILAPIQIDTETIIRDWLSAREQLASLLTQKGTAPLEEVVISDAVRSSVQLHDDNLATIAAINQQLTLENQLIADVKQHALNANPASIIMALARLHAIQARHSAGVSAACEAYLAEKKAKAETELLRDKAKNELDKYRAIIFPAYQEAINRYLNRFNTGYHIDSVSAVNTRGGPTCKYNIIINNTPVAVAGGNPQPGDHAFQNTLSAGDRNALALAFFFASIELDPNRTEKTIVIDDPVSSLDEHRSLTTVQEIRRLTDRVAQVIVLSHNKSFLCRIWESAAPTSRATPDPRIALQVVRDENSSTIESWNVSNDLITEHDRRDAILRNYVKNGSGNNREVAKLLRPHVEAFLRVACPEFFPPGNLLGPFRGLCEQRVNTAQQILNTVDIQELRDIVEYANRFHHEPNSAWENEIVNECELTGFVDRVLKFVKRR